MMGYKGYVGKFKFDDEAGIFHGEIINTRDVITFQGTTVEEIRLAFKDSVEDYLDFEELQREKIKNVLKTSFGAWKDEDHTELQGGVDQHVRKLRKSTRSERNA